MVFNPDAQSAAHKLARTIRDEWVIAAEGSVQPRGEGLENPKLATGQIEVAVQRLDILNVSETPHQQLSSQVSQKALGQEHR